MHTHRRFATIALLAALAVSPNLHAQSASRAAAVARARRIVSQMTVDEKVAQLHGVRDGPNFRMIPGLPRLGVPEFHITNGPAGVSLGWGGRQKPATAAGGKPR